MQKTLRPMKPEERARLEEAPFLHVNWSASIVPALAVGTGIWFAAMFALGAVAGRRMPVRMGVTVMFVLLFACLGGTFWYFRRRQRRATRETSRKIRARYADDVAAGQVEEWRIVVREAVEVEEFEDEGLQYYLELEDGRVLFLMGQYLYGDYLDQRFPNTEIVVVRLPHAGDVLDVLCLGDHLPVSVTRASFTDDEQAAGMVPQDGDILEGPISRFKTAATAMLLAIALVSSLLTGTAAAQTRSGCEMKAVDFKGWKAQSVSNPWVTLILVPQLGGRLMQVTFGGHDYLWVNDQLKGQVFTPEQSAAQRRWFNYGGDKLWPMPEGNDDEEHWPSAVGAVLDSGAFSFEVISKGPTCAVRMIGPPDPQVGLQYTREIAIDGDSPEIRFRAIMKNVTGYPLRWSVQSVSQYNVHDPKNPADYNHDLWGFTPAHPRSEYLNGYHVRTGQASNSAYAIRDGLFTLHFGDQGGEVWTDGLGPWVAVVDGATEYAMVERFHYERGAEYPDKSTVIFYTTGLPRPPRTPPPADAPPRPPIFYMEAEINSPMVELEPGESYTMRTEWFPTRMGSTFKTATYAGVVGAPLTVAAAPAAGSITLSGEFGVFFAGRLVARFYDREGLPLGTAPVVDVTPLQPVRLQATVPAPAETARVSLHLVDRQGLDRGPLGASSVALLQRP